MNVAMKEFNRITGMIDSLYHEAALKFGMTDSELDMFYIIANYGEGCNQSLLYKETGMSKSTVNTAIHKLEKADILYLETGIGRNTRVCLTQKGRENLHKIEKLIKIENKIYLSWTNEERAKFIELNQRFADQLKTEIDKL